LQASNIFRKLWQITRRPVILGFTLEGHLYIVVEAEVVLSVAFQQRQCVRHVEVLKLQHCIGIPACEGPHKLVHDLQIKKISETLIISQM
jgi:hypothetical protein